jgi:hypothetical protein
MTNTLIESDFTTAKLTDNEGWTVTNPLYTGSTSPISAYSASTDVFGGKNKFGLINKSNPAKYTRIGKVFSNLAAHNYLEFTVTLYTFGG